MNVVRSYEKEELLLLLVTVLSQTLFTLVRCNLMAFTFFSTRHNNVVFVG